MNIDDLYQEIENSKDLTVLVEGPNDKRSLERLGFRRVATLNKPLYSIVEQLQEEEELLILTDLDDHGRKLYKYFYGELTRRGVRVNNRLRLMIFQTPVRHIEGLAHFLERLELAAVVE
jgi:5S rRNA maturation endonuclease (ribonuclease M5)